MAKMKKEQVFNEMNGKSSQEKAKTVRDHVAKKEYSKKQFKEILFANKNNNMIIKAALDGFRELKDSLEKVTSRQHEAYNKAVDVVNKVIDDPRSTEAERLKALDIMDHCYRMLTATNILAILALAAAIIALAIGLSGDKRGNNNQQTYHHIK